jgi:hypothetical protein
MIVCLGWGSLIWRPENLALEEPIAWHRDGPVLPVEFARKSQKSRLVTLVLMDEGPAVPLLWAEMTNRNVDEARSHLAKREGTSDGWIGCYSSADSFPHIEAISAWARAKDIDGVVWTALPPRFDADDEVPSAEQVVMYLRSLDEETRAKAEEYVRKAPLQIRTPYRAIIERDLGWTPLVAGKDASDSFFHDRKRRRRRLRYARSATTRRTSSAVPTIEIMTTTISSIRGPASPGVRAGIAVRQRDVCPGG